jgi:oxalate---CoA ligase
VNVKRCGHGPLKDLATILGLISQAPESAPAILGSDRDALVYGDLRTLVEKTAATLAVGGIAAGDVVAMVLPNGPELATMFLAVASCAVAAPLNPHYRAEEFEFYLVDLNPKCLIVPAGSDTAAREVAVRLGIPIFDLEASSQVAVQFQLVIPRKKQLEKRPRYNSSADVALLLHTSGTTSRPKLVSLTSANLCASADHVRRTLALTDADRCLSIMPLFHIHGLIAAILSSVSAGACTFCAPAFNAMAFFGLMKSFRPTWYTAVPTMHQAILARASRNHETIASVPLRFIRSSSAAMPIATLKELEETFGCRVVEAYGMTEAAHQIASNPLPPRSRKPGSVGVPAGPEVAIMDAGGALLRPGETGEIVIRGANVTSGYRGNPAANAQSFLSGWFRTGDQGAIDEEGYLTINGRLKEIINRGGEKISPREIDEILLSHPSVGQAVAFAVPHEKLGEDLAAVVVLKEAATATELELRNFVGKRVAAYKVPRQILFLAEIPKGPTGKVQRIALAKELGLGG